MAIASSASGCGTRKPVVFYIGTYTKGWACDQNDCTSKGIYRATFDPQNGAISPPQLAAPTENPSYLAIHPNGQFLYAVNEVDDFKGQKTGAVTAFTIEPSGELRALNQLSSQGADPCHISLTSSGSHVLVANYSGGSIASFPVSDDGRLKEGTMVQHHGSSVHERQKEPHAHYISEAPHKNGLVYVADLGLDQVLVYRMDPVTSKLTPNDPPFAKVPAGGGPRHIAFHPQKNLVYTNDELSAAVTVFAHDPDKGALKELQTIRTLPQGFSGPSDTAEILVSQDGRFVYVSNRGHNSIAIFAVDGEKGTLTPIDHPSSGGDWPRDFKIDPTGQFMLVAHQKSNEIVVFRIDRAAGRLEPSGHVVKMSKPVNVAFLPENTGRK